MNPSTSPFRHMFLATDLSEETLHVDALALQFASRLGAQITFASVDSDLRKWSKYSAFASGIFPGNVIHMSEINFATVLEKQFQDRLDRLQILSRDNIQTLKLKGQTEAEILKEYENADSPCDLLIMGKKHHSFFQEFILGSTVLRTLKKITKPLLVIPADSTLENVGKSRILVATALNDNLDKCETLACSIAAATGATISLVHVLEPVLDLAYEADPLLRMEVERGFERAFATLEKERSLSLTKHADHMHQKTSTHITTHLLKGEPTEELVSFAEKLKPDLIILGHRPRGAVENFFAHDLGQRLIERVHRPILLCS